MPRRTARLTIKDSVAEEQDSMKTELEDALSPNPFVDFLKGVFVGYGSQEYNELCPRLVQW